LRGSFNASSGKVRPIRFQYPGAICHVMARGDGGKAVFEADDDRKSFVFRLGQVCASHGWRVHAWCPGAVSGVSPWI